MRSDFTAEFTAQQTAQENAPVNLLRIDWPAVNGNPPKTVYLSSRALTIGAIVPVPVVESWDKIQVLRSQFDFLDQSVSDVHIRVINAPSDFGDGAERFSELLNRYPAQAATVFLYQWFEDASMDDLDLAPMLVAQMDDSFPYTEELFEFDLVEVSLDAGQTPVGGVVTKAQYPNAAKIALGKPMPVPVGSVPNVPGLLVRAAGVTRLTSVVIPGASVLNVESTADFNASGTLTLNDDTLQYTGVTATQFTGVTGVNDFHFTDNQVIAKISDRRYLFADPAFPIQSITNVRQGNFKANAADYTIDLSKGEVVFNKPPLEVTGVDTKFLNPFFDAVAAGNTAINPANAFDTVSRTTHANISQANPLLKIQQTDDVPAIGEINAVLLRVEHNAEEKLPNDEVLVKLNGTQVGVLSSPSADDQAVTVGETQIILDHLDTLGFPITDPSHEHQLPRITQYTQEPTSALLPEGINLNASNGRKFQINFPSRPPGNVKSVEYQVEHESFNTFDTSNPALRNFLDVGPSHEIYFNPLDGNAPTYTTRVIDSTNTNTVFIRTDATVAHALRRISRVTRIITYEGEVNLPEEVETKPTGVATVKLGEVESHNESAALSATTDKTTNTVVEFFDVTALVDSDWAYFKNAIAEIQYSGSADGRTVFVYDAGFRIEFTRRILSLTDDISADVEGIVDDALGTVTGTPDALIEKPGDVIRWSLLRIPGRTLADLDAPSFAAADAKWAAAIAGGYKAAGVIQGGSVVRNLWSLAMKEFRCDIFFDPFNKLRVLYKPSFESDEVSGLEVRTILESMIVKRDGEPARIEVTKSPKEQLVNHIDLQYDRNLFKDDWDSILTRDDNTSQADFGQRRKQEEFKFEFTRGDAQAGDIADFWLAQKRRAYLSVECDVMLNQMDLESGDIVIVDHPLIPVANVFAEVLRETRSLGSSKQQQADLVRLFLRVFPISNLVENQSEGLTVSEALDLVLAYTLLFPESISISETPLMSQSFSLGENVQVSETALTQFARSFLESLSVSELELFLHNAALSESLAVSETRRVTQAILLTESGPILVSEAAVMGLTLLYLEALTVSESAAAAHNAPFAESAAVSESAFILYEGWGVQGWGVSGWSGKEPL